MAILDELVSSVRKEAGSPNSTEIDEATIIRFIQEALTELSRQVPNKKLYSVTLKENQADYDLEEGVYTVLWVAPYMDTATNEFFAEFDDYLGTSINYDWQMNQYDKLVSYLNRMQNLEGWSWGVTPDRKLHLIPAPSSSQAGKKCYYIGVESWTLDTLPKTLEKLVLKYATAQTLMAVARYRSKLTAPTRTGRSEPYSLYSALLDDGRRMLDEFYSDAYTESFRWFW